MKITTIIIGLLIISGCQSSNTAYYREYDQGNRIEEILGGRRQIATNELEEYVSRVGKKVMLVSGRSDIKYKFNVVSSDAPTFNLTTNSITISRGLLNRLNDEAELAAILSHGIVELSENYSDPSLKDDSVLTYMARAGYDPAAAVELQQKYLRNSASLGGVYSANPPTASRIDTNKARLNKLPKGLHRGTEIYSKNVKG